MYGLNPSITGKENPNSPYYENPCDFCKYSSCSDCIHNTDKDDDKMPEDEMFDAERLAEMYQDII